MKNKILAALLKASGSIMSIAFCIAVLSQNSTCASIFHQPKMPEALIEADE